MAKDQISVIYSSIKRIFFRNTLYKTQCVQKKFSGFSLLEILFVMVIAAMAFVQIGSRIAKKNEVVATITAINELFERAYLHALLEDSSYEVHFFFDDDKKIVKIGYRKYQEEKNDAAYKGEKRIDESAIVKKLIVAGNDEMAIGKTKETWLIVYPTGHTQPCEIHLAATQGEFFSVYTINPFSGVFREQPL